MQSLKDVMIGIRQRKFENEIAGYVLFLIAIRMFTYSESFEIASEEVNRQIANE